MKPNKHVSVSVLILGLLFAGQALSADSSPCKTERQAMRAAMKQMRECHRSWKESVRSPAAPEPGDDCSEKQKHFISAARAVKKCKAEKGRG